MTPKNDNSEPEDIILRGPFIIQRVYEMEFLQEISENKLGKILEENLPKFKSGNPEEPGKGFKVINRTEITEDVAENQKLFNIFQRLIIVEFQKERFYTFQLPDEKTGKLVEKKYPKKESIHIFIIFPDYILIRGSKSNLEFVESTFFNAIRTIIKKKEAY